MGNPYRIVLYTGQLPRWPLVSRYCTCTHCAAVHTFAVQGHIDAVEFLLQSGADIDSQNSSGATALHSSAANGAASCVELLLQRGADVNVLDAADHTARHCAILRTHDAIVKIFENFDKEERAKEEQAKKSVQQALSPTAWHKEHWQTRLGGMPGRSPGRSPPRHLVRPESVRPEENAPMPLGKSSNEENGARIHYSRLGAQTRHD